MGLPLIMRRLKQFLSRIFLTVLSGFVWGPMENMFNTALQDVYLQQTRLTQVRRGGDLQLSGEITNYDAANKGIGSDGYSNMVELRMTVRVNFVDKANPKNNFNNQQFSASREYKSSQQRVSRFKSSGCAIHSYKCCCVMSKIVITNWLPSY